MVHHRAKPSHYHIQNKNLIKENKVASKNLPENNALGDNSLLLKEFVKQDMIYKLCYSG